MRHRIPPTVATLLVITVAGCGSAGTGGPVRGLQDPGRFAVSDRADAPEGRADVPIAPDLAWEILPAVFEDLGFSASRVGATSDRIMTTPRMRVRGAIYPGERTSDYLDCGTSNRGAGARADSYEVTFLIATRLTAVGTDSTRVATIIDGQARDPMHGGVGAPCRSTGKFEEQIVTLMRRLARARSD